MKINTDTPVLALGGRENTVALVRNLGRIGVTVRVSGLPGCAAMDSRFCRERLPLPENEKPGESWRRLLLSPDRHELDGHLLFACCDDSLEFITENQEALRARYILEDFSAELRRDLLDKKKTLELAAEANVPAPRFWMVDDAAALRAIKDEISFPVMIKPLKTHSFAGTFGRKLFIIQSDIEEVVEKYELARRHGHEVMVAEMIPGPDDLLCSYYTFIDEAGEHLYHYTKRVLRRWPVNRGGAVYHITEWLPEAAELGQRFFDSIGWRGTANIEFKRDVRDGTLKIIEVNSRFTAAHRLVVDSGAPIDRMIYCKLTGQRVEGFDHYEQNLRMWYPLKDFLAYRELSAMGKLTFLGWLKSILFRKKVLPDLDLFDPGPTIVGVMYAAAGPMRRLAKKRKLKDT